MIILNLDEKHRSDDEDTWPKKISAKTMNLMIFWPERAWEAGIGEVGKM